MNFMVKFNENKLLILNDQPSFEKMTDPPRFLPLRSKDGLKSGGSMCDVKWHEWIYHADKGFITQWLHAVD